MQNLIGKVCGGRAGSIGSSMLCPPLETNAKNADAPLKKKLKSCKDKLGHLKSFQIGI